MNIKPNMSVASKLLSPGGRRARLLVFCFHRVLAEKDALRASEPDVREFTQDVQLIARHFNVLSMSEAIALRASDKLPAAAACITFDDGYADNHEFAAPVLEAAQVPATFYIASGAVDEGFMWNDLVVETIARRGSSARFDVLPVSVDEQLIEHDPASGVLSLLSALKYLPAEDRTELAISFYKTSTGIDVPRLMMTRAQIADLAARGFELGGHTLGHPILSRLEDDRARAEIEGCRDWLVEVTGQLPVSFAYPNGLPGKDFTPRDQQLVRKAGFTSGVSTHWAAARPADNPFAIPRVGPWWRLGFGLRSGLTRVYVSSYLR